MTSNTRTFLVPVANSVTLRDTVSYAMEAASDAAEAGGATVHFVVVARGRAIDPDGPDELTADRELLERVETWTNEDRGEADGPAVETAVVGLDRYLFSPGEYADTLLEYATEHGVDRIVLDPEYDPGGSAPMLRPLQVDLARGDVEIEEAAVERQTRRTVLARAETLKKAAVVFGASFLFYVLLGSLSLFDVVTGAITAGIAALLLAPVTFGKQPSFRRLGMQIARSALYVPFLLWEITKANLSVAYVVLRPSLPIDPKMVELRAAVWGDTPVTTLANSITLTPGTLTVDVAQRSFTIHSLTASSREDLLDGALERAVRFVFYGRAAARIASPAERGDGEVVDD